MCGIAGMIDKHNGKIDRVTIRRMTDRIVHRGPDAEGIYIDGNIGMGHRRLSILDLSDAGTQPMFSHDNRYCIVFNGEIYNYRELKKVLCAAGAVFKTNTDTEVILEAYRRWGIGCTARFNGMWSFVLYDTLERKLFFSRDRFGVKPLYILENEDVLCFASEIKCITEVFPDEKDPDVIQIRRYLYGIQEDMDERTFYKNIKNFPKCHNMLYTLKNNKTRYIKYWDINVPKFQEKWGTRHPYKVFRKLLEDAIRLRLRADVEVGASLSGGLDSSTIVGIVSKKYKKQMHTFSSIYKEEDCNEKEYIDCMRGYVNAIGHNIYPDQEPDFIEGIKNLIYFHDGPCRSASPYSGYCVYRGVGKRVKVLLDGQGADELFGGYLFFYDDLMADLLKQGTLAAKIRLLQIVVEFLIYWPEGFERIRKDLLPWGLRKFHKEKLPRIRMPYERLFCKAFHRVNPENEITFNPTITSPFDRALNDRLEYEMLPRILHDVDRNSMAYSLEVRLPFLDYRLVEFSYSLQSNYKIRGAWTKYIIRKSCKKYLPRKIRRRRNKMGFPAPFNKWVVDERYRERIKKYLCSFKKRGIVNDKMLDQCYEEQIRGQNDYSDELFRIMALEIWLQNEIDTETTHWNYAAPS